MKYNLDNNQPRIVASIFRKKWASDNLAFEYSPVPSDTHTVTYFVECDQNLNVEYYVEIS